MSPLEKLVRAIEAPKEAHAWAAIALSVDEARQLVDYLCKLQDENDQAHKRVAELEAAARRCADCGRGARELIATQDGDGSVVYLGPGCARKRMQGLLRRAQALPIGGER